MHGTGRAGKEGTHVLKGIFHPFELGGETSLIRSAVIQPHERSIKPFSAA
jgi:hypothetical protein